MEKENGNNKKKGVLNTGTMLQHGRYRIIRYISQGGFGCTYEAEHTVFNERVAIKELFISEYCNRDEGTGVISVGVSSKKELIERMHRKFINEARAQRKMQHPNIVRVIDVFEENSTAYYVMDYIDGDSLETIAKKRNQPMPEREAVGYIRMIADALEYVHSQKCLHLDVKPGNIMIDRTGKAILIDFGASKQYDEQGNNESTITGFTRGYAPIEQVGGHINIFSPASDVFSLGSTLYRLLTGEMPVDSLGRMSGMTLKPLPADISPSTRAAVESAMKIPIGDRPQNIQEFLHILNGSEVGENPSDATKIVDPGGGMPPIGPISDPGVDSVTNPDSDRDYSDDPADEEYHKKSNRLSRRTICLAIGLAIIAFFVTLYALKGCGGSGRQINSADTIDALNLSTSEPAIDIPEGYVDLGVSKYWARDNLKEDDGRTLLSLDDVQNVMPKDSVEVDGKVCNRYALPTEAEWMELRDKCIWEYISSPAGYKVSGVNGQFIFFSADGIEVVRKGEHIRYGGSVYGNYWTSTEGVMFTFKNADIEFSKVVKGDRYSARLVYDPKK